MPKHEYGREGAYLQNEVFLRLALWGDPSGVSAGGSAERCHCRHIESRDRLSACRRAAAEAPTLVRRGRGSR